MAAEDPIYEPITRLEQIMSMVEKFVLVSTSREFYLKFHSCPYYIKELACLNVVELFTANKELETALRKRYYCELKAILDGALTNQAGLPSALIHEMRHEMDTAFSLVTSTGENPKLEEIRKACLRLYIVINRN